MENKHDEIVNKVKDAFIRLRRMHRYEKSPVEGVRRSEVMTLMRIRELSDENGAKVSDISHSLRVSPPTVTQVINALEKNGLIKREIDSSDRRSIRVILTEQGEDVRKKAIGTFRAKFSGLVDILGEEKSMTLVELLNESIEYLKEEEK